MKETKPVSVRMDVDLLTLVDRQVARHTYWNRSSVICNILEAVLTRFDEGDIYNMLRAHYYKRNKTITKFEVTDELLPLKSDNHG